MRYLHSGTKRGNCHLRGPLTKILPQHLLKRSCVENEREVWNQNQDDTRHELVTLLRCLTLLSLTPRIFTSPFTVATVFANASSYCMTKSDMLEYCKSYSIVHSIRLTHHQNHSKHGVRCNFHMRHYQGLLQNMPGTHHTFYQEFHRSWCKCSR